MAAINVKDLTVVELMELLSKVEQELDRRAIDEEYRNPTYRIVDHVDYQTAFEFDHDPYNSAQRFGL